MLRSVTFILIAVCFIACTNDTSSKKKANSSLAKSKKVDLSLNGQELFVKHCKLCHGIDGRLQMNGAKDFKVSDMSLENRIVVITEGKNAMTPFKKVLTKAEIKKVAAYTIELTNKE